MTDRLRANVVRARCSDSSIVLKVSKNRNNPVTARCAANLLHIQQSNKMFSDNRFILN